MSVVVFLDPSGRAIVLLGLDCVSNSTHCLEFGVKFLTLKISDSYIWFQIPVGRHRARIIICKTERKESA